jgi:hypothetical protein
MSEINRIGTAPPIICSEFDDFARVLVESESENERGARNAMRDDREAARAAGEMRVGAMRDAADMRLVTGLANAVSQAASAASSAAGTAAASARTHGNANLGTDAAGPDATATPGAAPADPVRSADFGDYAPSIGKAIEAAGAGLGALFDRMGADADTRGERARMAADDARSRADESRGDAEAAARAADKTTDLYASTIAELRRSEEAATRA